MTRVLQISISCLFISSLSDCLGADDYYSLFLSRVSSRAVHEEYLPFAGEEVPSLTDTSNTSPKFTRSKLTELALQPQLTLAGVHLGMTMDEVVKTWGKPRRVSVYGKGAPMLLYQDCLDDSKDRYASANVLFNPASNKVMTIWITFWQHRNKPLASPRVEECLRVLGEPIERNFVPDPLEEHKQPPKHWYCRMVYKQPPLVLYFAGGQLMALEVNAEAKGVAPEGKGSDDYSIKFCLE